MKRKINIYISAIILVVFIQFIAPAISQAVDLKIAWSPVHAAIPIGYRVYFREAGQSYDYRYPIWEGEETTCTIYGLEEGGTYHMVLRAHDFNGNESANSSEITYELGVASVAASSVETPSAAGGGGGGGCFIQSAASDAPHDTWRRLTGKLQQYLQVIRSLVLG
jgi:hypothetical protein